MNATKMMLAVLLAMSTVGAWAQAPFPQMVNNQPTNGTPATPIETNTWGGTLPYSSQANFNMMEDTRVPQGTIQPSTPSYIGVLGEKWETDKRGRRSTFIHNGQEMSSVGYGQSTSEPELKTHIMRPDSNPSSPDSLIGRITNPPYPR